MAPAISLAVAGRCAGACAARLLKSFSHCVRALGSRRPGTDCINADAARALFGPPAPSSTKLICGLAEAKQAQAGRSVWRKGETGQARRNKIQLRNGRSRRPTQARLPDERAGAQSRRSTCARTVHERVVFSLFGLAFERKQIPRFVVNVVS